MPSPSVCRGSRPWVQLAVARGFARTPNTALGSANTSAVRSNSAMLPSYTPGPSATRSVGCLPDPITCRPGPHVDDVHARSLRAALLIGETLEITDPGESEDIGNEWAEPRALTSFGARE